MLFLRMISTQLHWRVFPDQSVPWLRQGEILSEALSDLKPKENTLSVYEVGEDADEDRIAVAFAASREKVDKVVYAIFNDDQFAELGIDVVRSEGKTPDASVNEAHCDLQHLTIGHVVGLAESISSARQFMRKLPKEVKTGILEAIDEGILDQDKIRPKLKAELLGTPQV